MDVREIAPKETYDMLLTKHYAQRIPSISFAFGLFVEEKLEGVLTIGKPASPFVCKGVCGPEHSSKVYELNRLIVNEGLPDNILSRFVARCLKALKSYDLVIVSYADTGAGHTGYIYQATNFLYIGISKERTDKYMPGNKHARHYTDEYNHLRKVRTSKHRYIYFTNTKNKKLKESLRYEILPYPKSENKRYKLGDRIKTKVINTETGGYFFE